MNWGKCDFEELKRLDEKIKKLEEVDFDETCRKMADKLAQILLAKVVKLTPVGVKPDFDMSRFEGKELTVKVKVDSFRTVRRRAGNGFVEYKVKTQREREFLTKEGAQLETMRNIWNGYQGGTLRRAWQVLPVAKSGSQYVITVVNDLYYASYVEYGHRQTPGRYVPALGKALSASWVKGKFMLTVSEKELMTLAPKMLEAELDKAIEEAFNVK